MWKSFGGTQALPCCRPRSNSFILDIQQTHGLKNIFDICLHLSSINLVIYQHHLSKHYYQCQIVSELQIHRSLSQSIFYGLNSISSKCEIRTKQYSLNVGLFVCMKNVYDTDCLQSLFFPCQCGGSQGEICLYKYYCLLLTPSCGRHDVVG